MLRKHINSIPLNKQHKIPFYSWECISLQLKNREVDLVIKSEENMQKFIKFLVYTLRTVDGLKGSAEKVIVAV
jgi:hypothetical protein